MGERVIPSIRLSDVETANFVVEFTTDGAKIYTLDSWVEDPPRAINVITDTPNGAISDPLVAEEFIRSGDVRVRAIRTHSTPKLLTAFVVVKSVWDER